MGRQSLPWPFLPTQLTCLVSTVQVYLCLGACLHGVCSFSQSDPDADDTCSNGLMDIVRGAAWLVVLPALTCPPCLQELLCNSTISASVSGYTGPEFNHSSECVCVCGWVGAVATSAEALWSSLQYSTRGRLSLSQKTSFFASHSVLPRWLPGSTD